tara:strand:+ start:144 stop:590 length:447 start_codon:yes stop_codon:yes gene_type:complete
MKIKFNLKDHFKKFCYFIVFLVFLITQTNFQTVNAIPMENYTKKFVTEELRLKVPFEFKEAWLDAERNVWEPWLTKQEGFLGRQIFWNKEKEEALILVKWENKKLWKNISMKEVNQIQQKFEENVKSSLNLKENPFELMYEGELYKQK